MNAALRLGSSPTLHTPRGTEWNDQKRRPSDAQVSRVRGAAGWSDRVCGRRRDRPAASSPGPARSAPRQRRSPRPQTCTSCPFPPRPAPPEHPARTPPAARRALRPRQAALGTAAPPTRPASSRTLVAAWHALMQPSARSRRAAWMPALYHAPVPDRLHARTARAGSGAPLLRRSPTASADPYRRARYSIEVQPRWPRGPADRRRRQRPEPSHSPVIPLTALRPGVLYPEPSHYGGGAFARTRSQP